MTTEKILSVVRIYRERFEREKVPKKRMPLDRTPHSQEELLSHAHYLLDGIEVIARNPEKVGKTGRHLGSVQTLLLIAGWYTLGDLMNHNRPE